MGSDLRRCGALTWITLPADSDGYFIAGTDRKICGYGVEIEMRELVDMGIA